MARGSIRKCSRQDGVSYEVVVDLGPDPVTGKRRQRTRRFKTKREAQAGLTEWLAEIDKGTAVDRSRQTVSDLLEYWMEAYARHNVRATTLEGYGYTINRHIIPSLGSIPLQKLTPAHLQQFYADKLASGCGPRVVQLCHLRLRQALAMAEKLGLVARNVADVVAAPRVPHNEMQTWSVEEAQAFLAVAKESHYGPIWLVAMNTGMRRGELLGLRWQDIDWGNGVLHVRQAVVMLHGKPTIQAPKSRSAHRVIPLEGPVIEALREHRTRQNERRLALGAAWHDHQLVFPSEIGTPVNARNLDREYRVLISRAGVSPIRIHDIRHTFVTLALASGSNLKALSELLGHAKTSITMDLYAHAQTGERRAVVAGVGKLIRGETNEVVRDVFVSVD